MLHRFCALNPPHFPHCPRRLARDPPAVSLPTPHEFALPAAAAPAPFRLRHVLPTNLYGTLPIADIVPQLAPAGCIGLDIWAGRWGNQREQIDALGHDRFAAPLAQHRATVSCYTCLDPGFQRCEPHLRAMKKFGGNQLVADVAPKILYFYAWQFGDGSGDLAPSKQKRQLPGIGPLGFKPMLAALKRHRFAGYTSIFMHPTPRGSPLHSTVKEVTAELNKARAFLERELAAV